MAFWTTFWGLVLLVGMLIFSVVTVVVAIRGFSDVKSLFQSIEAQHRKNSSDSE